VKPETLKFYKYVPVAKPQYQGKFCHLPFTSLEIDEDGDVILCGCALHMPYTIGNIYENSLTEIWHNQKAQQVRDSVATGEFTYCNWACSYLPALPDRPKVLPAVPTFPTHISLKLDLSCNLKCPTCRESTIMEKNTNRIAKQIEVFNEIKEYALAHPDQIIEVNPLSSGEVFASHSGLHFLKSLVDYPYNNLRLQILTNGTLINHHRDLIKNISHLINGWSISIDAATPETYAQVRGGNWQELWAGIELVNQLKPKWLATNFCIQEANYHEIEAFADRCVEYGVTSVHYQRMNNFAHWTIQWWHDNNALDRNKSSFEQTLNSIETAQQRYPKRVNVAGDIANYLKKNTLRTVT